MAQPSQVELFISCQNLPKLDLRSKSDPFAVVSLKEQSGEFAEIGRTGSEKDAENPEWKEQFKVDYFFEESQEVRIDIYDRDSSSEDLRKHDHAGYCVFVLGEVLSSPGQAMRSHLVSKKKGKRVKNNARSSYCTIKCEEVSGSNDILKIQFKATSLHKMDMIGGADPYLQIYRVREDESWLLVHKTETIQKSREPIWKTFNIGIQALCNADYDRPLWLKVWDWDAHSDDDLIGEVQCSLRDILEDSFRVPLKRFKNEGRKKDKIYGYLEVRKAAIKKQDTFLDYIRGGCSVSLMVAVDFTGSNGPPQDPRSLHFLNPDAPNEYVKAITSIGGVLAPYDTDQKIPVWGFGGRVGDEVSHCFALSFDESNPEVDGVNGILDAYFRSFQNIRLSGPTLFQQILQMATVLSSVNFDDQEQKYFILLIITDGIINDMQKTIDAIVGASNNPLSIIIVGVGQADFSKMEALDADKQPLTSARGEQSQRDIVQFVPFRDFEASHIARLAKVTLAEVPKQFLGYAKQKGVGPMDPAVRLDQYHKQMEAQGLDPSGPMIAQSQASIQQDPAYYDGMTGTQMETAMYQAQASQNRAEIARLKQYMLEKQGS